MRIMAGNTSKPSANSWQVSQNRRYQKGSCMKAMIFELHVRVMLEGHQMMLGRSVMVNIPGTVLQGRMRNGTLQEEAHLTLLPR